MPNVKGATRKPTALLALTGALEAKPGRYGNRASEPTPDPLPKTAPKHLTPELKLLWKELLKEAPPGVLTASDKLLLEITCRLIQKMRMGTISTGETAQLLNALGRMGMTPVDRARVSARLTEKPKEDDEWSFVQRPSKAVC
jgi:phage terminase small subunit